MTGFEFKDENDDDTATLDIALLFDATTASKVHDNNIELNLEINDYLKTLPPRIVYQIIAKCQEISFKFQSQLTFPCWKQKKVQKLKKTII